MSLPFLQLVGFSKGSHTEVVARTRDALSAAGASIMDFHMFSNAILCLSFELSVLRLSELEPAIESAAIRLDLTSSALLREAVASAEALPVSTECERLSGTLSVNVINDEPVLRIEVPAVPG